MSYVNYLKSIIKIHYNQSWKEDNVPDDADYEYTTEFTDQQRENIWALSEKLQILSKFGFSDLIKQFYEIEQEEGDAEINGELFYEAINLVLDASINLEGKMLRGSLSCDEAGNVRIDWTAKHPEYFSFALSLSENQKYIYHNIGNDRGLDPASPTALTLWISRANSIVKE